MGHVRWGKRPKKEGWLVELLVIRTQVLKHLSGAKEGERGGSKKDVKRGATAREAMEESEYVKVIEGKKVRRDDPIECFLPVRV